MLPHRNATAARKLRNYFRRLLKFDQMDFEAAAWQMTFLLVAPTKVYRNAEYRRRTKRQLARDDPAFLLLFLLLVAITSFGYAVALKLSLRQFTLFLFYAIFIDCLAVSVLVATAAWLVSGSEWGYAFDVHLNACFPSQSIVQWYQVLLYGALLTNVGRSVNIFIGNTVCLVALVYYIYVTFLGYTSVAVLKNTRFIIMTIPFLFLLYGISIVAGVDVQFYIIEFYLQRVY